ncbi:MAG: 6-pyruvoyl-tetrahydropterin synthase-related protein [Patescibacteria group bacterium]
MNYRNFTIPFAIALMSLIPLLDLFHPGLPITHDGEDHVIRVANFYRNLEEGNMIPRWSQNLNYGFGHPVLMFFYPLPYYTASVFHFLGFSFIDSTKLFFGITYILSGIFMFLFIRKLYGETAGIFSSMLYLLAPYRFVDFYVRGAIGEHAAFLFVPLTLYFLVKFSKCFTLGSFIGASLSMAGLVLTHNAVSLMFLPFLFLYVGYLVLVSKARKSLIFTMICVMLIGFGVSAFFWVPGVFEAKYTLRNIVTSGEYSARFIKDVASFAYGHWSYGGSGEFSVQIGIVHLLSALSVLTVLIFLPKKNKPVRLIVLSLWLYSLVALFLMLPMSSFIWQQFIILQNFQFPWRFLSVIVFTTSFLGGIFIYVIPTRYRVFIVVALGVSLLLISKDYWHAKGYLIKNDDYFRGVKKTTTNDTGESSPIWSVRFMEHKPKAYIEVIDGKAMISTIKRSLTVHRYRLTAVEKSRIRENTLYFPGWEVFVDGIKQDIEFQDPQNRGLMTFMVEKGKHAVDVRFTETKLRMFADIVSLVSIVFIIGLSGFSIVRRRRSN